MILESLCKQYGQLDFICRSLFRSNSIEKTWFFNGRLYILILMAVRIIRSATSVTYMKSSAWHPSKLSFAKQNHHAE